MFIDETHISYRTRRLHFFSTDNPVLVLPPSYTTISGFASHYVHAIDHSHAAVEDFQALIFAVAGESMETWEVARGVEVVGPGKLHRLSIYDLQDVVDPFRVLAR